MKNNRTKLLCKLVICTQVIFFTFVNAFAQLDPIRLTMKSSQDVVNAKNDEFEITIEAKFLQVSPGHVFILEDASSFAIKVNVPTNFIQTGGTYRDFIGGTLSSSNPSLSFTIKGRMQESYEDAVFQLLRGPKGASNVSTFTQAATLTFKAATQSENGIANARQFEVAASPGYISYLSLDEFYNTSFTEDVIYITDPTLKGLFKKDTNSTAAENGGTVLVKDNIRYLRVENDVINVSWFGIHPDGVTNQSAAIQSLLNGTHHKHLYFPRGSGSYRIGDLRVYSNTKITFENGVTIQGTQEKINATMFYLYHANNITIQGENVVIDDSNPDYVNHPTEWRNIFGIYSGKDIVISGIKAINGGGDGFYIGAYGEPTYSENIKLINVVASGNRRQGLSIISGKNIHVLNSIFENTSGLLPGAGIDIEPNHETNFLENIYLKDIITRNNQGAGIIVAPRKLSGTGKYVSIFVDNHFDDGSAHSFVATTVVSPLSGIVKVQNPVWINSRASAFVARNWSSRGPVVELMNPTIQNSNEVGSSSVVLGSAILVYRPAGDDGDTNIGNVHVYNASIQDTRTPRKIMSTACFRDIEHKEEVKYCSITNFLKLESTAVPYLITHNASVAISDIHTNFELDLANFTRYVNNLYWASLYHNGSSTAVRYIRLEKVSVGFPEITIEVRNEKQIRLLPLATESILPLSPTNGKYIYSSTVGSRIKLKRMNENSWSIVDMTGDWQVEP